MQREISRNIGSKPIQEGFQIDPNFKPAPVHLAIMKMAKDNEGIYERRVSLERNRNANVTDKLKDQMDDWNRINIEGLVDAGILIKKSEFLYILNPLAEKKYKSKIAFEPGKNHIELLRKNENGVINYSDIKEKWINKKSEEQKRQKNMHDGMLKKLIENGYIERKDKGIYLVTEKGFELLKNPKKTERKKRTEQHTFKLTAFDEKIKEVCKDGRIDKELLSMHKRRSSIEKRIETLKRNNLIDENLFVKEDFFVLLEQRLKINKAKELTIDMLTDEQLQLVKDLRIFLNLSKTQIKKHIYTNSCFPKFYRDLDFLVSKGVIKRDEDVGVYILDKLGIEMSNDLYPGAVKYGTKLYSRKEEMEHDMLVYSAYKDWEREAIKDNIKILALKNDRQMRSDDAKKYGHMQGAYPDLRVLYEMNSNLSKDWVYAHDIEIDCGYDGKTIESKIRGMKTYKANGTGAGGGSYSYSIKSPESIGNQTGQQMGQQTVIDTGISWYCNSMYQAIKVANILSKDNTKARTLTRARKVEVFYMDKEGNTKSIFKEN